MYSFTSGDLIPASNQDTSGASTPDRARSKSRDPFFHRPSRSQSRDPAYQREQQLSAIQSQVHAAQASTRAGSEDRERSRSRAASRDPFFRPESRADSQDPHRAQDLQHQAIMAQVRHAEDAHYASDLERALRNSRHDTSGVGAKDRSTSHIRNMIKAIASDPFFHRPGAEEDQAAQLHQIILAEVAAAKASTAAGAADRQERKASRSRSRAREGEEVGSKERSQSRLRSAVSGLLGGGDTAKAN